MPQQKSTESRKHNELRSLYIQLQNIVWTLKQKKLKNKQDSLVQMNQDS